MGGGGRGTQTRAKHRVCGLTCADKSKPVLEGRDDATISSLRDENGKGEENENPFPASLNRCNATSVNERPTEAVLMRHSRERAARIGTSS